MSRPARHGLTRHGQKHHGHPGGLHPSLALRDGHSLHPVNATLVPQPTVGRVLLMARDPDLAEGRLLKNSPQKALT